MEWWKRTRSVVLPFGTRVGRESKRDTSRLRNAVLVMHCFTCKPTDSLIDRSQCECISMSSPSSWCEKMILISLRRPILAHLLWLVTAVALQCFRRSSTLACLCSICLANMAYCVPQMQYSVNVDPSMMHSQIYQEPQMSSPMWSPASSDHSQTHQAHQGNNGPMLLLMPPLLPSLGQMSPCSPSPCSPMSPSPLSPTPFSPSHFSPSPLSPVSGDYFPGSPARNYMRSNSGADASEAGDVTSPVMNSRSSKGPISKLQEFVQSSKAHPLPSSCAVLQWSHENRMAGSSLQFRATTSFLLDGVPHHVLGGWWPSKKQSQRDAAERALAFFIGMCGQELAKGKDGNGYKYRGQNITKHEECPEEADLEAFVGQQLQWSCRWEAQAEQGYDGALCKATVDFTYLGIPHVFAGKACTSKAAARADTAKRVLWYLHAPGYENVFEVEQEQVKARKSTAW